MSKKLFRTIGTIASVVAGVALIGTGIGSALGGTMVFSALGASVAASTIATVAGVVAMGASMLSRPKGLAKSSNAEDRLSVSIDPRTPRKFVLGHTAMATDIRDQEFTNNQEMLHRFVVCASHQTAGYEEIWFDDKLAWSAAGGIQGEFVGYLGVETYTLGSAANAKNISARMGSSRRYTGLSWIYLRYKLTGNSKKAESPFAQSIPSRVTVRGKGALTYDPRLDSTVPGGAGPMRAGDQTTWTWSDNASRNPAIQLLWYLLGWRIQNPVTGEWRLAVGKGIPAARIDLASFITAANLCDEPVALIAGGTQPRYRSDCVFSEGDSTSVVLDQLKASMNAELDDVDGKIRITVLHNDLATPLVDFNDDDILSGFTWDQTAPLDETYNVVRGAFIDPSNTSLYQAVDYPEVRIPSPDGIDRVDSVDFQAVQDGRQAQRLVKQRIARMLYSGRFTATFSYRAWRVQKNDVVRLTFAALGWTNKLFRVIETGVQVDGQVPMVLQEEHPDIYLWDRDERAEIQPVEPTRYDPYLNPVYQDVIDPKYGDGTPIDQLRPAEPGATNGATPEQVSQIDLIDAYVADMRPRLDLAEQKIEDLESSIVPPDLDELRARILAAEGDIQSVQTELGGQDARITTAQTTADTTAGNLAELTTRVSTAEASVSETATAVQTLDETVAQYALEVQAYDARITQNALAINTVEGQQASLSTEVSTLESSVSQIALATQTLEGDVASLRTRVSAGSPNLLINGGIEEGTRLWSSDAILTTYSGVWGPLLQASTSSQNFYVNSPAAPAEPGGHYTGSMDSTFIASSGLQRNELIFINGNGAEIGRSAAAFRVGHDFDPTNGGRAANATSGIAPPGTVAVLMQTYWLNVSGLVVAAIRQCKIERGSTWSTYSAEASVVQSFQALSTLTTQYASLDQRVTTQGVDVGLSLQAITELEGDVTMLYGRAAIGVTVGSDNVRRWTGIEINGTPVGGGVDIHADFFRVTKPGGGENFKIIDGTIIGRYPGAGKMYQLGDQALN